MMLCSWDEELGTLTLSGFVNKNAPGMKSEKRKRHRKNPAPQGDVREVSGSFA